MYAAVARDVESEYRYNLSDYFDRLEVVRRKVSQCKFLQSKC